jgi:hypothetical protein
MEKIFEFIEEHKKNNGEQPLILQKRIYEFWDKKIKESDLLNYEIPASVGESTVNMIDGVHIIVDDALYFSRK